MYGVYAAQIERMLPQARSFQEALMTETCNVRRDGALVVWPRMNTTTIPCRVGEERTFAEPSDPQDANTRSQAEWAITMPWDMDLRVADFIHWNALVLTVGETNNPQTWLVATRGYITKPKTAVAPTDVTLYRTSWDTGVVSEVGTFPVKIVFARVDPIEIPSRFSFIASSSWRSVTLIFEDVVNADVQKDDHFVYQGKYGVITHVVPGQNQRTEAHGLIDFGAS